MPGSGTEMHFDKTDQKTWLEEIVKEIGKPALEELEFIIDPDWSILPFQHADDIDSATNIRSSSDRLKWSILERFGTRQKDNKVILASLQGGCESMVFETGDLTFGQLSDLLEGVRPEMVEIHFQPDHADQLREIRSAFYKWTQPIEALRKDIRGSMRWFNPEIEPPSDVDPLMDHIHQLQASFPNMKGICWDFPFAAYDVGLSGPMASSFRRILNVFDRIDNPGERRQVLDKSMIRVTIGQDYFREMIRLRAIRLLWYNLLQMHGLDDQSAHLEVHFHPGHYTPDTEKNMIKAGTMALSAILGGADAVYILPGDGSAITGDIRLRRIARNIHHLLRYESHLEKHTDPVRGAYFFEAIVPALVRKVWDMSLD